MVEGPVDKIFDLFFYLGKITNHALLIEGFPIDGNGGFHAMPMQVPAFAGMVHQTVAVTEINFFGNGIHDTNTSTLAAKFGINRA